jgi:hypothetical protein
MDLRHAAHHRNELVEFASDDLALSEWSRASRVWSRQADALRHAIIGEPPTNLEDALSVLVCLAEMRHEDEMSDNESPIPVCNVREMTDVAIHNCIRALAANVTPSTDPTETEVRDVDWSAGQCARWLPDVPNAWTEAVAERARLDTAEEAAAAAGNDDEAGAQQALRFAAEDKLMAMPAPDGAGLALKVMIAIGQDRASIPYQAEIEADARRLAGLEVAHDK